MNSIVFSALNTALACLALGLSETSKRSSSSLSSKMLLKLAATPEKKNQLSYFDTLRLKTE